MNPPTEIVFDEDPGRKSAAIDEENDGYGKIGDDCSFRVLSIGGYLNLRRNEDEQGEDEQEPLVDNEPPQSFDYFSLGCNPSGLAYSMRLSL
jgi:hypothetical protein